MLCLELHSNVMLRLWCRRCRIHHYVAAPHVHIWKLHLSESEILWGSLRPSKLRRWFFCKLQSGVLL
jgi:hypothetical protein